MNLRPLSLLACLSLVAIPAGGQSLKEIAPAEIRVAGGRVSGSFRLTESPKGIPSTGTGGACLVADLGKRRCNTDDDCRPLHAEHHPAGAAYCLRPKSRLGLGTQRCWVRPGPQADYCRVSPAAPHPLDRDIDLPSVAANPRRDGKPVRWLVHACLNRHDPQTGKDHPGCKTSDPAKMKTWSGRSTTVHP